MNFCCQETLKVHFKDAIILKEEEIRMLMPYIFNLVERSLSPTATLRNLSIGCGCSSIGCVIHKVCATVCSNSVWPLKTIPIHSILQSNLFTLVGFSFCLYLPMRKQRTRKEMGEKGLSVYR